jgi:hypothetical protein
VVMQEPPTDNPGQFLQPPPPNDPPSEQSSHTLNQAPGTPDEPWVQKYLLTLGKF